MLRGRIVSIIDAVLGWRSRSSGAVTVGRGTTIAWRRIRRASGNRLSIGDQSIVHADISFEEKGGELRDGNAIECTKSGSETEPSLDAAISSATEALSLAMTL